MHHIPKSRQSYWHRWPVNMRIWTNVGMETEPSQQTRGICLMLFQCWASNVGPALKQHWVNAPCLLGSQSLRRHVRLADAGTMSGKRLQHWLCIVPASCPRDVSVTDRQNKHGSAHVGLIARKAKCQSTTQPMHAGITGLMMAPRCLHGETIGTMLAGCGTDMPACRNHWYNSGWIWYWYACMQELLGQCWRDDGTEKMQEPLGQWWLDVILSCQVYKNHCDNVGWMWYWDAMHARTIGTMLAGWRYWDDTRTIGTMLAGWGHWYAAGTIGAMRSVWRLWDAAGNADWIAAQRTSLWHDALTTCPIAACLDQYLTCS